MIKAARASKALHKDMRGFYTISMQSARDLCPDQAMKALLKHHDLSAFFHRPTALFTNNGLIYDREAYVEVQDHSG